jgi:hypothetical protein
MHAQQAALFLGQFPHPETGERITNLEAARLFIDQLAMIRTKTRGNLNEGEERILADALASLQMAFVEVARGAGAPGAETPVAGEEEEPVISEAVPGEAGAPGPEGDEGKKRFTKSYG